MSRIRILMLNLHNPAGGRGLDAIEEFLDESHAELLAVSECQPSVFDELATRLACAGFSYARAPFWGNGILTRNLPLHSKRSIDLFPTLSDELRSAAAGDIRAHGQDLRFVVTHLEYGDEQERLDQLSQLSADGDLDLSRCVLLGDLNSLNRSDKDPAGWEEVTERRRQAGIRPPSFRVMEQLLGSMGFRDALKSNPPGEAGVTPTCPYGTRVDYVLLGPACLASFVAGSYHVLPAMARGISDHDAVLVELDLATPSQPVTVQGS